MTLIPAGSSSSLAEKTALLVLGAHRSGTSAFTRVLNLLGADLPSHLLDETPDNPRGFWESAEVVNIHEEILATAATSWDDWRRFNPAWYASPLAKAYQERLLGWLERDFGASGLFVIKDPRMCRLVPLWLDTLRAFGAQVKAVITLRNPVEVAASLERRDGFTPVKSHLIWLRHMLDALRDSADVPRCVISYDALLSDWRLATTTIARRLDVTWPRSPAAVASQIDDFLSAQDRHHVVEDDEWLRRPEIGDWVKRGYREMLAMTARGDSRSAQTALDALAEEFDAAIDAFGPVLNEGREAAVLAEVRRESVAREADRQRAWQTVEELRNALTALQAAHATRLEQLFRDGQTREDDRLAAWRTTEGLNVRLAAVQEELERSRAQSAAWEVDRQQAWQTVKESQEALTALHAEHATRLEQLFREGKTREDDRLAAWRTVEGLNVRLAAAQDELERLLREAQAREDDRLAARQKVERLEIRLADIQEERARTEDELRRAALSAARTLEEERVRVAARVQAVEEALAAERARVADVELHASDLATDVRDLTARSESSEREMDTVWRSRSWRVTEPLRASMRLARAARTRLRQTADRVIAGRFTRRRLESRSAPPGPPQTTSAAPEMPRAIETAALPEVHRVPLTTQSPLRDPVVRLIAFYLPQFHPIPENDEWWGKGFTEWNNVTRGTPQFVGHYQPHLPGELGFYDLRVPEVQRRQVELAKLYGIGAFCFYFYWFGGKRLLEAPLQAYLEDRSLDLPFCVCWANENWTRRWDGMDREVLIAQQHSPEDDLAFIAHVARFFQDPRYLRVGGRPLLLVYRPKLLPSPRATAERWRAWCRANGIGEIYLAYTQSFETVDPEVYGFDAAIEFPPNNSQPPTVRDEVQLLNPNFAGAVFDWRIFVKRSREYARSPYRLFRGVAPSWDNEARRPGAGAVFWGSSPAGYREWLTNAALDTCRWSERSDERLVFVNAWNEWAEGTHLEPDRRYGYAYLQATRDALETATAIEQRRVVIVTHDAYPHGSQYIALHLARGFSVDLKCSVDVVVLGDGPLKPEFARYATVHDLTGVDPEGPEACHLAARLFVAGARSALCNTAASGLFLSTLKRAGFRCVSLIHEMPGVITGLRLESQAQRIASEADVVVFPARPVADGFERFAVVPPDRVAIRPPGLYKRNAYSGGGRRAEARATLRAALGLPDTARIVLGVGFADHRKGIDLFVEVGRHVLPDDPEVWFVWLGHHDERLWPAVVDAVRQTGVSDRFLFLPRDPVTDLYYAGADVYALTSREDPFPAVVLEALDVEVPVVAFAGASGSCELLEQGCGLLVPAFDVEAYARAIRLLLSDEPLARRLGLEGRRRMRLDELSFRRYLFELACWLDLPLRRVSVVVPNYNYAGFLSERLRSIASQTYPVFELIVLDDASTDDSAERLREMLPSLGLEYTLVVNEHNSASTVRQWGKGVDLARGELVWIAEADDVGDDGFLAAVVRSFTQDPSVVMSYCQSRQMGAGGTILCEHYLDYTADISSTRWREPYIEDGIAEIRTALAVKNTVPNVSAVVFSRDALRAALEAVEHEATRYRVVGDWLVYLEVLKRGRIAFVPQSLNSHRRHGSSVTLSNFDLGHLREVVEVQRMVRRTFQPEETVLAIADAYAQALFVQFGFSANAHPKIEQHPELAPLFTGNPDVSREATPRRPSFGERRAESLEGSASPSLASWLETMLQSLSGTSVESPFGDRLPKFPDPKLQANTTGLSGAATVRQAFAFYEDIQHAAEACGLTWSAETRVLDFGVGWGRIARLFLRDVPLRNLWGIDVDPAFVELTQDLFVGGNISVCAPFPPTALPGGHFDLVSAYSVFSHLSERACRLWTAEFARLLRPGGLFAFTTRHEDFFAYCAWAASQPQSAQGYVRALGELFPDIEAVKAKYRRGEFVHATSPGVSGGGPRTQSFYGETFIPRAYVERRLCAEFELIVSAYDPARYDQACFVLRRR